MKKWIILGLAFITAAFVLAMPLLALPVLFTEIANDLELTIFQIGVIWGISSLAGLLTSLPLGAMGDRFGPRATLTAACLFIGLFGAARGFSFDYTSLLITGLLHGLITPAIPSNTHKTVGLWFPGQRGMASGVVSAGFAVGLTLGSALSATVLSPWLGGWKNVLIFFGIISVAISLLWFFLYPATNRDPQKTNPRTPYLEALRIVAQSRQLWVIGLGSLCFWVCYRGFTGYLPVYLKEIGWNPGVADQTLSLFYLVSLIGVIPLSTLSDRLKIRRELSTLCVAVLAISVFSLSFTSGFLLWLILIISGFFFDAFMAIHQVMAQEVEGIGATSAATAIGFVATLREVGGFIGPPVGNALAGFGLAVPFVLWGAFGLVGAGTFLLLPKQKSVTGNK